MLGPNLFLNEALHELWGRVPARLMSTWGWRTAGEGSAPVLGQQGSCKPSTRNSWRNVYILYLSDIDHPPIVTDVWLCTVVSLTSTQTAPLHWSARGPHDPSGPFLFTVRRCKRAHASVAVAASQHWFRGHQAATPDTNSLRNEIFRGPELWIVQAAWGGYRWLFCDPLNQLFGTGYRGYLVKGSLIICSWSLDGIPQHTI